MVMMGRERSARRGSRLTSRSNRAACDGGQRLDDAELLDAHVGVLGNVPEHGRDLCGEALRSSSVQSTAARRDLVSLPLLMRFTVSS